MGIKEKALSACSSGASSACIIHVFALCYWPDMMQLDIFPQII